MQKSKSLPEFKKIGFVSGEVLIQLKVVYLVYALCSAVGTLSAAPPRATTRCSYRLLLMVSSEVAWVGRAHADRGSKARLHDQ
jgi:hypothetical protein